MALMETTYPENISPEELSAAPLVAFTGNIRVVDTPEAMEEACEDLSKCKYIGFDTETRPSFKKGKLNLMSLVQLSTGETAYLIRINKVPFSESMRALLENEENIKIGASLHDDFRGMRRIMNIEPRGFVDLQNLAGEYGIKDKSLRKLSAIVLEQRISKAQRLSNWEAKALTPAQQSYAATDAWVCREIYLKLKENR